MEWFCVLVDHSSLVAAPERSSFVMGSHRPPMMQVEAETEASAADLAACIWATRGLSGVVHVQPVHTIELASLDDAQE